MHLEDNTFCGIGARLFNGCVFGDREKLILVGRTAVCPCSSCFVFTAPWPGLKIQQGSFLPLRSPEQRLTTVLYQSRS